MSHLLCLLGDDLFGIKAVAWQVPTYFFAFLRCLSCSMLESFFQPQSLCIVPPHA
jgi:hypothetical protein